MITKYPPPPGYQPPGHQPSAPVQRPFSQPQGWAQPQAYGFGGYNQQPQQAYQPPPQTFGGHQFQPSLHISRNSHSVQHPMQDAKPPIGADFDKHSGFSSSGIQLYDPPIPREDIIEIAKQPDAMEHDFDDLCYYWANPDEIDPNLSLGWIESRPPQPSKKPLPPTFDLMELEIIAPLVKREDETSISEYCTESRIEATLMDVRQTDRWGELKDDTIFRTFSVVCDGHIPRSQLREQWMARRSSSDAVAQGQPPTPELSRGPTPTIPAEPSYEPGSRKSVMETTSDSKESSRPSSRQEPDALDAFEEVLRAQSRPSAPSRGRRSHSRHQSFQSGASGHHSRNHSTHSTSSQHSQRLTRPKPMPAVHDETQEDILAKLGVTGSAKTVFQTPGPAFGPPPTASKGSSRSSSFDSNSGEPFHNAPPPPQHQGIWPPLPKSRGHNSARGQAQAFPPRRHDSGNSSYGYSQDMDVDDNDATPKASKVWRGNETRKRSYADSQAGAGAYDNSSRGEAEDDERTPKQRKMSYLM